jgi:hypothetical protein
MSRTGDISLQDTVTVVAPCVGTKKNFESISVNLPSGVITGTIFQVRTKGRFPTRYVRELGSTGKSNGK